MRPRPPAPPSRRRSADSPELRQAVQRLAHRDRHRGRGRQPPVRVHVVGVDRLFQPGNVQRLEGARAADRLGHRKALVGVHHDVPVVAHGLAHGGDARHVLGHMGPPDLELGAMKAFRGPAPRPRPRLGRQVQPAAPRWCRAGCGPAPPASRCNGRPARRAGPTAPCRWRPARSRSARPPWWRAPGTSARATTLHIAGLAARQHRRQVLVQQARHGRAAGADGVAAHPTAPSLSVMRTMGVSCRSKLCTASVRTTLGNRSTRKISTDAMRAMVASGRSAAGPCTSGGRFTPWNSL